MYTGYVDEWAPLVTSLATVKTKSKILVPGNHDFHIDNYMGIAKAQLRKEANVKLTNGISLLPNKMKLLSIPYVTGLKGWAFNVEEEWLEEYLELAIYGQEPPDIVVSHSPPYRILDKGNDHFGSLALNKWFYKLKNAPLVWICGHVHECYGSKKIDDCRFYNVAHCNDKYEQTNPPVIIEI